MALRKSMMAEMLLATGAAPATHVSSGEPPANNADAEGGLNGRWVSESSLGAVNNDNSSVTDKEEQQGHRPQVKQDSNPYEVRSSAAGHNLFFVLRGCNQQFLSSTSRALQSNCFTPLAFSLIAYS